MGIHKLLDKKVFFVVSIKFASVLHNCNSKTIKKIRVSSQLRNVTNLFSQSVDLVLVYITFLCQSVLSYRSQSSSLQSKSIYWFLYDRGFLHKRINCELWMHTAQPLVHYSGVFFANIWLLWIRRVLVFEGHRLPEELLWNKLAQLAFTCSKSAMETPEQCVKSFQS